MDSPKRFLLQSIIDYKTNGLESLGHLNAKHVDDIAEVMNRFVIAMIHDVIKRLNKGESIDMMDGTHLTLQSKRKDKKLPQP